MATLAEITRIIAPASAEAGKRVDVEVRIRNNHYTHLYFAAIASVIDSGVNITLRFGNKSEEVGPFATVSFTDHFTMPDKTVRLWVWSFYWNGTTWIEDDSKYIDIALEVTTPTFQGFAIGEYTKV